MKGLFLFGFCLAILASAVQDSEAAKLICNIPKSCTTTSTTAAAGSTASTASTSSASSASSTTATTASIASTTTGTGTGSTSDSLEGLDKCIQKCRTKGCTFFTYTKESDDCNTDISTCEIDEDADDVDGIITSQPGCYDEFTPVCNDYPSYCADGTSSAPLEFGFSRSECESACSGDDECALYTFYPDNGICQQYESCEDYEECGEDCYTNLSGDNINCDGSDGCSNNSPCSLDNQVCSGGSSLGAPVDGNSKEACKEECEGEPGCTVYTWYGDFDICLLYSECDEYDDVDNTYTGCLPSCREKGKTCIGDTVGGLYSTDSLEECREECEDEASGDCVAFTQYEDGYCILYSSCDELEPCDDCETDALECSGSVIPCAPKPSCEPEDQACSGSPIKYVREDSVDGCKEACLDEEGCNWYTFYSDGTCGLFEECELLDSSTPCYCKSGATDCA